jgi:hypothetical protein
MPPKRKGKKPIKSDVRPSRRVAPPGGASRAIAETHIRAHRAPPFLTAANRISRANDRSIDRGRASSSSSRL